MPRSLAGKAVLITGGAKRVGAAISRRLHGAGADLVLHYHSARAEAKSLTEELNGLRPDSVISVQSNLLNDAELAVIVKSAIARFGRLDVLVNNASSFYETPFGEIKPDDWDNLLGTNLKAPLFLSQAAAPHLKKASGCIVNLADIHAERPLKNYLVYSVAKAGLVGLTKALARELGPEIRVNAVAPGPVMWPEDGSFDELARQRVIAHTLLKRSGDADDIARTVYFLIADAPFVTGQVIVVDGGRSVNL